MTPLKDTTYSINRIAASLTSSIVTSHIGKRINIAKAPHADASDTGFAVRIQSIPRGHPFFSHNAVMWVASSNLRFFLIVTVIKVPFIPCSVNCTLLQRPWLNCQSLFLLTYSPWIPWRNTRTFLTAMASHFVILLVMFHTIPRTAHLMTRQHRRTSPSRSSSAHCPYNLPQTSMSSILFPAR